MPVDSQEILVTDVSDYQYGPDGLRRTATVGNTTTHYGLDGQSAIQEWKPETGGTDWVTYMTGGQGPIYRLEEHKNGGTVTGRSMVWYVYDGQGSVIGEVDTSGLPTALKKARVYDVFGGVRRDDYTEANQRTSQSKHRYVGSLGHQSEGETGLIYMRARYMDPETGRFVSEDPAGDGSNWYSYCGGNPVNLADPEGKLAWNKAQWEWYVDFLKDGGFFLLGVGMAALTTAVIAHYTLSLYSPRTSSVVVPKNWTGG